MILWRLEISLHATTLCFKSLLMVEKAYFETSHWILHIGYYIWFEILTTNLLLIFLHNTTTLHNITCVCACTDIICHHETSCYKSTRSGIGSIVTPLYVFSSVPSCHEQTEPDPRTQWWWSFVSAIPTITTSTASTV